jgi:hypothetical protein
MQRRIGETPDAQEIADRIAIQEILHAHSRGIDRCDQACIESAYWPEAEVAYGAFDGRAHDFAAMVVEVLRQGYELTRHSVTNTLVDITGARAHGETYVAASHLSHGAEREMLFFGRYLDRFEKRGRLWKILHRRVVMDWSRDTPVDDVRDGPLFARFAKGGRMESDPLHAFLARGAGGTR